MLLTIDEDSYSGGAMGEDHPMAWYRCFDGGRTWYTAGGHTIASWSEPAFVEHVVGGLLWSAGAGACP